MLVASVLSYQTQVGLAILFIMPILVVLPLTDFTVVGSMLLTGFGLAYVLVIKPVLHLDLVLLRFQAIYGDSSL